MGASLLFAQPTEQPLHFRMGCRKALSGNALSMWAEILSIGSV